MHRRLPFILCPELDDKLYNLEFMPDNLGNALMNNV